MHFRNAHWDNGIIVVKNDLNAEQHVFSMQEPIEARKAQTKVGNLNKSKMRSRVAGMLGPL